jgi:hypothetical protein
MFEVEMGDITSQRISLHGCMQSQTLDCNHSVDERRQTDRAATHDRIGLQTFQVEFEISRAPSPPPQATLGHRAIMVVHGIGVHVTRLAFGAHTVRALVDTRVPALVPVTLLTCLVESQLLLIAAAEPGELEGDFAGAGVAAFRAYVIVVVGVVGVVFVVGNGLFVIIIRVIRVVFLVVIVVLIILVIVVVIVSLARWLLGALRVYQLGIGDGARCCVIGQFDDFNVILDQYLDDFPDGTCSLVGMNRARS